MAALLTSHTLLNQYNILTQLFSYKIYLKKYEYFENYINFEMNRSLRICYFKLLLEFSHTFNGIIN